MIYVLTILFTLALVMYQRDQQQDLLSWERKHERNTGWKSWANVMKVIAFVMYELGKHFPATWQDYLLAGSICILLFELATNKIGLNRELFFIGASSKTEKLKKWKWYLSFALLIISITIKIFL